VGPGCDDGNLAQHLCCSAVAKTLMTAVMAAAGVTGRTDPSHRLISTYRYLTRLGDNHVIATQDEDREKPVDDCHIIAFGGMFSF
jgi:hypothetical protein